MKFARKPEKRDFVNAVIILLLAGIFLYVGIEYSKTFKEIKGDDLISSAENLRQFLLSYDNAGIAMTILLHVVQVVISIIPGMLVQFAGGAIYGMIVGMVTGVVGVSVGTAISFCLSRYLGKQVITLFVSEKTINKFDGVLANNTSYFVLMILFVIPGFPKDFIPYFAGLTNINAFKFFIISAVGRLPGMIISTYLGAHVLDRNYPLLIGVTAATFVSFVLIYIFRDKILKLGSKA